MARPLLPLLHRREPLRQGGYGRVLRRETFRQHDHGRALHRVPRPQLIHLPLYWSTDFRERFRA